jgi:hypothetical protein
VRSQPLYTEPEFINLLRSQVIDSQPGGIDSKESVPNGSLNVYKYGLCSLMWIKRIDQREATAFGF